ncbi:hypothetical protein DXG03_003921, partial [Asterophora parasitica]
MDTGSISISPLQELARQELATKCPEVLTVAQQEARDFAVVDEELQHWLAVSLITSTREREELDLVRFWQ